MTGLRRRRTAAFGMLVAIVGVAVAAWLVGSRVRSPAQAAARAAAPVASLVTAPVELRVLSSTVITRGDVVPAVSTAVTAPAVAGSSVAAGGSGVVTAVFVERGDEVDAGDRVVEVAGRPVFVFAGATPAYRALRPGMTGADVAQLQLGLSAGGCDAGDSDVYDEATKACVEWLYAGAGYELVRGSETEVVDLATAESAVAEAEDALVVAQSALTAASAPAPPGESSAARAAVNEAQRGYDAAVREQPELVADAVAEVDATLAALNGVLAGSDPDAATSAGGPVAGGQGSEGGETGGTGAGAEGGAGGGAVGTGVAGREAARRALADALDGVDDAVQEGADAVASADSALVSANDALADVIAAPDVSAERLAVDQAATAVERATEHLADLEAVSGAVVPYGEVVFVPELPARIDEVSAIVGQSAGGSGDPPGGSASLATVASPTLRATVSIPQASRDLVREGTEVDMLDELTGETVAGAVSSIGEHIETSATSGQPGYPAVIEADLPEEWSGRNVRVTFTAASTDHEVLVVPSAAVSSAADGATRVQVERIDGTVATVAVIAGLLADGFVEVAPVDDGALGEGERVVIGE